MGAACSATTRRSRSEYCHRTPIPNDVVELVTTRTDRWHLDRAFRSCETSAVSTGLRTPATWLDGPNRQEVVRNVTAYMSGYAGRFFEPLAARSDPNAFEATDIVAVTCLSVDIPR